MKVYNLTPGVDLQFTASLNKIDGFRQDITTSSHWVSSDTNVATVQTLGDPYPGLVTPVSDGPTLQLESVGAWYWYGNDGQIPITESAILPGPQNTYQLNYTDGWSGLSGTDTNAGDGTMYWFSFPTWPSSASVEYMYFIPHQNVPLANSWFAVGAPFDRFNDPATLVTEQGDQPTAIVDQFQDGDSTVVLIQWPGIYRYSSLGQIAGPFSIKFQGWAENFGQGDYYTMTASFVINDVVGNPQV